MKAVAVIPKKNNSVSIVDFNKPEINQNEVLVKVLQVGLDGTDKEINEGLYGEAPAEEERLIIGHESLGEVVEVGDNVTGFETGNLVVATVRRPDNCINCTTGETDMCLTGNYTERGIKGAHGFLAEYYAEKPDFLIKVPKKLANISVLLEPVSIAEKAIRTAYEVQKRMIWKPKTALVTGTGTLGLLIALLLRLKNLDVISIDRSDKEHKKKIFKRAGIVHFNSKKIDLADIPKKINKQFDMIIEATGSSTVAMNSMSLIGINGVVVLTSITGGDTRIEIGADHLNQGLVLGNKAVVGIVNSNRKDFVNGIKSLLLAEEKWPGLISNLITVRYKIDDIRDALESMSHSIKTVIEF